MFYSTFLRFAISFLVAITPSCFQILKAQYVSNQSYFPLVSYPENADVVDMVLDDDDNTFIVSTKLVGNQTDIALTKYDDQGDLDWERIIDHHYLNDYGLSIVLDSIGNPIVLGSIDDSLTNRNILLKKYNSVGTLQWTYTFDGVDSENDYPTRMIQNTQGDIYITGSTWVENNMGEVALIKINKAGAKQWDVTAGTPLSNDIGAHLSLTTGGVNVIGADYGSSVNDDFYIYEYKSDGTHEQTTVKNLGLTGIDTLTTFADHEGALICAGVKSNDLFVFKVDTLFDTLWTKIFDFDGESDLPLHLTADGGGNIYIAGYGGRSTGHDALLVSLDKDGHFRWSKSYFGSNRQGDHLMRRILIVDEKVLVATSLEDHIFHSGILAYDTAGNYLWNSFYREVETHPLSLFERSQNEYALFTCVNDTAIGLINIDVFQRANQTRDTLGLDFKKGELVLTIDTSYLNHTTVDRIGSNFFELGDILDSLMIDSLIAKYYETEGFGEVTICRVFTGMKTTDTTATALDGSTIRVAPMWNSLLFCWDDDIDEWDRMHAFAEIEGIQDVSLNLIAQPYFTPNDTFYSPNQLGLQNVTANDSDRINMQAAWDIQKGDSLIRVGVFDSGIGYDHEDLGAGAFNQVDGSIVIDGYDYVTDQFIDQTQNKDGGFKTTGWDFHGTKVAGIIAGRTNNQKGVAGIAGGDEALDQDGVSLYALKMHDDNEPDLSLTNVANALKRAVDSFKLHVVNASFGYLNPQPELYPYIPSKHNSTLNHKVFYNTIKYITDFGTSFICARGQDGVAALDQQTIPSIYPDYMVNSVTASDTTSHQAGAYGSTNFFQGSGTDLMAPGVPGQLYSTYNPSSNGYIGFDGTSVAAAVVSGVAGLIMSEANKSTPLPEYRFPIYPEDVSNILAFTATDKDDLGFDTLSGAGLINAAEALKVVDYPKYRVHHFDDSTANYTLNLYQDSIRIVLSGGGEYGGHAYDVTYRFSNTVRSQDSILTAWGRPSRTDGYWFKQDSVAFSLADHAGCVVDSFDNQHFYVRTRIYHALYRTLSGVHYPLPNGAQDWFPFDPNRNTIAFSALVYDANATPQDFKTEVEEIVATESNWTVYPNPSGGIFRYSLDEESPESMIHIYNLQGQLVLQKDVLSKSGSFDLSSATKGIYIAVLESRGQKSVKKLVIE